MINIRRAEEQDISYFKEVVEESILELCKNHYSEEQIDALLKQYPGPELYRKWISERVLLVAEKEGTIVGFAQFDPTTSSIEAVHVLPRCTYQGIGRMLVGKIENAAEELGILKITLGSSINADNFYAKCGYIRKYLVKFKCNNGVELDTVAYEKEIKS
jgi:GNAT superfamily N-acetyltransferase